MTEQHQTTEARRWTARIRKLPDGDVVVSLGGTEHVMSQDQAMSLEALLMAVRLRGSFDTGERRL
jgi:hypothetical protein